MSAHQHQQFHYCPRCSQPLQPEARAPPDAFPPAVDPTCPVTTRLDLARLVEFRHRILIWSQEHPAQALGVGVIAAATGAGLLLAAPAVIAFGAGVTALGVGIVQVSAMIGGFGLVVGVLGRDAGVVRKALVGAGCLALAGGAVAGAGLVVQGLGVLLAIGGGILAVGGLALAAGVVWRLRRPASESERIAVATTAAVQRLGGELRERGANPSTTPIIVLDLRNPNHEEEQP